MVCLGNICRSPLAHGILQYKIDTLGLDWEVDSAGTSNWHAGEKPDRRSVQEARRHDIDITTQRSRQFSPNDFEVFDIIYAMDASNYANIISLANTEEEKAKVKMIMNELDPGMNQEVPDPYFGEHGFENVFNMLDNALEVIVEKYGNDL